MRLDFENQVNPDRKQVTNRIIHLVDIMNIKELLGWEDINFSKITTLRNNKNLINEELNGLLEELEKLYQRQQQCHQENKYLNSVDSANDNWRLRVPDVLKVSVSNFDTKNKNLIELYAKDMLLSARGKHKKELIEFLECIGSFPAISEFYEEKFVKDDLNDITENQSMLIDEANFEEWRSRAPRIVRVSVPEWDIISLSEMEFEVFELMYDSKEKDSKNQLKIYLDLLEHSIQDELKESNLDEWRIQVPRMVRVSIPEWRTISLSEMEEEVISLISTTKNTGIKDELEDYLGIIYDFLFIDDKEDFAEEFDPLAVIAKYKNGAISIIEETTQVEFDDSWRNLIPTSLKLKIKDWNTAPLEFVYDQAKGIMDQFPESRNVIMPFVVEMSQIIFEQNNGMDKEISPDEHVSTDDISDSIMSLVEMIILPHLEVLEIIKQKGGKITFSNLWNKPFTKELKKEVKDRDGWKCVICEAETDLHVHHKIPRDKGGIHHKENLVTLCASCHGAVETADIKKAFKKCLSNYKKREFSNISRQNLSQDKKLLKEEIENSLDALLFELNNKEEHKLVEDVIGIMKRLEIIFYD